MQQHLQQHTPLLRTQLASGLIGTQSSVLTRDESLKLGVEVVQRHGGVGGARAAYATMPLDDLDAEFERLVTSQD